MRRKRKCGTVSQGADENIDLHEEPLHSHDHLPSSQVSMLQDDTDQTGSHLSDSLCLRTTKCGTSVGTRGCGTSATDKSQSCNSSPSTNGRTGSRTNASRGRGSSATYKYQSHNSSPSTNGRTGSRTNAFHGCGTSIGTHRCGSSATDECQSRNSSPRSRTNASHGRGTSVGTHGHGTSATDECQSHDSYLRSRTNASRGHRTNVGTRESPEHDNNVLDGSLSPALSARSDTDCPACDTNFNKDWVACDRCDTWFHIECPSIPLEMYSKIDIMTWFCCECKV